MDNFFVSCGSGPMNDPASWERVKEVYDYDTDRLNRHKTILLRYIRRLLKEREEMRARFGGSAC